MTSALKNINYRNPETPQSEKAAKGQVKNNAGGYTFKVTPLDLAKRFLILGSETNFYQSGAKLSKLNADNLIKLIEKHGKSAELVDLIVEAGLDAHDFMARMPVIEGAGGIVTDWQGAPLTRSSDGRIVAAGDPRVHESALKLLALTTR